MNGSAVIPLKPEVVAPLKILSLFGIVLLVGGAYFAPEQVWPAVLLVGFYMASVGLSALLFVAIHHLTGAAWSVPVLPVARQLARAVIPGGALVLVALAVGWSSLYPENHWHGFKGLWLTPWFVLARALGCVAIWVVLARAMAFPQLAKKLSAGYVVIFAITFSIASVDWIMALEPAWYSTVLGVYQFAGAFTSGLAALAIAMLLTRRVAASTLHDLAKLIFAFSTFWMYIWFSQFMLIWYGNLGEEAAYFTVRMKPAWVALFSANVLVNWAVPFVVLLSSRAKQNPKIVLRIALLLLAGRWLDLYLSITPAVHPAGPPVGGLELGITLGLGSAALLFLCQAFRSAEAES